MACSYSLMKDLNVLIGFVDDLLICVAFSVRSSIFFFICGKKAVEGTDLVSRITAEERSDFSFLVVF